MFIVGIFMVVSLKQHKKEQYFLVIAIWWLTVILSTCKALRLNIPYVLLCFVVFLECNVAKLDLAFVVDGSGSITQPNFDTSKEFVKEIVKAFEIEPERIRVGFIQYSSWPSVEFRLNDYMDKQSLLSAIDNIL